MAKNVLDSKSVHNRNYVIINESSDICPPVHAQAVAQVNSGVVSYMPPDGGGEGVLSSKKDIALLEYHLSQAAMLAVRVRPEIAKGLEAMMSAKQSMSLPRLQPHALPPSTLEEMPAWAKRVASLTAEQLEARREKERLKKQSLRAKAKKSDALSPG